ncbi:AsmA family protein [Corallincola platygyrae]|uniref:AsmA family protein n=1 Tax=Corallincola platygyrae TaxID=1193278 RepID=A0ABW4XVZ2_9GAMM
MGKLLKGLAIVVGVLIAIIVVVLMIFDPNKYKPEITTQVEQHTGRTLRIEGDIGLQLFPSIGFAVDGVSLSNAAGFPEQPMLQVESVSVAVDLMPLLSGQIVIDEVALSGATLRIQTKDGVTNLDDLASESEPEVDKPEEPQAPAAEKSLLPNGFYLGGVSLSDLSLVSEDLTANTRQQVVVEQCFLGPVAAGMKGRLDCQIDLSTPELTAALGLTGELTIPEQQNQISISSLELNLEAEGEALPKGKAKLEISTNLNYLLEDKLASLKPLTIDLDGQRLDGSLSVAHHSVPVVRFELASDLIDVDALLPPQQEGQAEHADEEGAPAGPAEEPNLQGLKGLDVSGTLAVKLLKASGLEVQDLSLAVKISEGQASVAPLLAKFYGGDIALSAHVNGNPYPASYELSSQVRDVEALPLVKALAEKELISGKASVSMRVKGVGLTPDAVKAKAQGRGNFEFKDGAVNGINVPHLIRSTYATLTGSEAEQNAPQKTDFTSLTGSFNIKDGSVTNPDLLMMSPLLRLNGKGNVNLLKEDMDYRLLVALVASLEGQGGKGTDDLTDVEIPLHISGAMTAPDISLDLESAMSQKLKGDLEGKLDEKLKENEKLKSLKDKLGDFL